MEDSKKFNKITDIVRLQLILKRWRRNAINSSKNNNNKSLKFLKRTFSFSNTPSSQESDTVPKGYLAVCVGEEQKRFVIRTEHLGHPAFAILLRDAEDEFGFQNEGVLRIPCDATMFETTLKAIKEGSSGFCSAESTLICQTWDQTLSPMHVQMIF